MATWRHPTGITERSVDDSTFLHVDGRAEVVILNPTAHAVWRLATGSAGFDDLLERVAAHHGVEPELIDADVRRAVDDLVASGLLV